ncbi:M23 family metallopeptidase [Marinobacterium rhizophilum]|uniref:Peptidoglycan DD-metalloendopeptidase family protein n=1 Tax=Marinobacterium rhizophilum TaxID=420402 RepID=A0ABY5HSG2_9GAMM|nr:M23 family metallopeptidase [Marinobacterium rhizophilum]UTW14162.1 peptidoglycan DD-metalloendopeptidase family protein [Marinobacterium rhizophilum]
MRAPLLSLLLLLCVPGSLLQGKTAHAAQPAASPAIQLPQESRVPGGVALVPFQASATPRVSYQGNRVLSVPQAAPGQWLAVVGIPLDADASLPQQLDINGKALAFDIEDKTYKAQYLTIKNQRHVDPDPEDLKRWAREKAEMDAAFSYWSEPAHPVLQFTLPAQGRFSSPFGLKRYFNQQPRNPHSGLDIAAPEGTPIQAPAPGVVRATGNYFFNGNTVILDHGFGLTSLYCHLSRIDVRPGQTLSPGEQLGLVGKTGRVTGAHLHWSLSLNNVRVDPLLFIDKK